MKQFGNLAASTLNAGISDSDTSLTLNGVSLFPSSGPFDVLIDSEIITVGARSGTSCTDLIRGVGGTSAAAHSANAAVRHILTAEAIRALRTVVKRKASTETVNNSAAYQNDNDLSFDIGANEVWVFEAVLFLTGSTTADFKVTMSVPAGATLMSGVHGLINSATSAQGSIYAFSGPGDHQFIGAPGGAATAMTIYRGIIVNGATAGTAQLQWAQQSATVADTSVVAGSFLTADEVQ